jgi:hypothetical protein
LALFLDYVVVEVLALPQERRVAALPSGALSI